MSDAVKETIDLIVSDVKTIDAVSAEKKRMANSLCAMIGLPPVFDITEPVTSESAGITSGEFYGQPLASVVRKILDKRRIAKQGPATVAEIFDAMLLGDYAFETSNADNAKRGLRISLTKNPVFHKLPSGKYGLREWFPAIKERKSRPSAADDAVDEEVEEVEAFHEAFHKAFDAESVASTDAELK